MTGPHLRRCKEDERFLDAIIQKQKRPGYILDTRTISNSMAERVKSKLNIRSFLRRFSSVNSENVFVNMIKNGHDIYSVIRVIYSFTKIK